MSAVELEGERPPSTLLSPTPRRLHHSTFTSIFTSSVDVTPCCDLIGDAVVSMRALFTSAFFSSSSTRSSCPLPTTALPRSYRHSPFILVSFLALLSSTPASFTTMASAANTTSSSKPSYFSRENTVIPPKIAHRSTIIFIHGLGDSSDGFRGMFQQFSLPYTRVVLPNAPIQAVTVNGGMKMRSWYDIHSLDRANPINTREDRVGILKSRDALEALLTSEAELVGGADRVMIGGFSQGAAMSLITGLSTSHHIAGIIALSGYLLLRDDYPALLSSHAKSIPIFMAHGKQDPTIPYAIGALSYEKLKAMGANIHFEGVEGLGHNVDDQEVTKVMAFINTQLGGKGDRPRKDL